MSLNLELTEPKYNANPNRSNEKYEIDAKTRKIIEKYNLKDMDLYLKAKNRFTELCQKYSVDLMNRLAKLENQSIFIIRNAYHDIKKLCLLWSIGKDSTVLLWLVRKAFLGQVPLPLPAYRYRL
jgi:hypothetical protein